MNVATLLAQLDDFRDPVSGSAVPAIQLGVATWPEGGAAEAASGYGRSGNGTGRVLERVMAALEGGAAAAAFTSGTAVAQALLATLAPGDHVLFDTGAYYEFANIFGAFGRRWGVAVDRVDVTDLPAVRAALRPGRTKLLWAECPSNPLWRVPNLPELAGCVHEAGARLLVDATVATPVLCTPLRLGADLVLHSATKFLNGHGDVLAGVLVGAAGGPAWQATLQARTEHGSVLPPMEAWLVLRGLRTLAIRMERVSASALRIARALRADPAVTAVHYPGLPDDPWHAAATAQFAAGAGFGGMVSFQLPSAERAKAVCAALRVFRRATSLGSTESLAEHRLTTEGTGSACPPGLLRLSVGLEDASDLVADLLGALRATEERFAAD